MSDVNIKVYGYGGFNSLDFIGNIYSDENIKLGHHIVFENDVYLIENILVDENHNISKIILIRSYTFDEDDE